ncbi:MAG: hypothetical protein II992_08220 [Lachnospiraceae bacterium]|nr:hypothetical protein [Lachnospiraceae bacterium]
MSKANLDHKGRKRNEDVSGSNTGRTTIFGGRGGARGRGVSSFATYIENFECRRIKVK